MLSKQSSENQNENDDKNNIAKSLTETIKKDGHPLDLFVKRVVNSMLTEFCIPWLVSCLQKYSEDDFHKRMLDPDFDFVNDWKTNHAKKFKAFILGARRLRYAYDFNSQAITMKVIAILENNDWKIDETETIQLFYTMESLKDLIES